MDDDTRAVAAVFADRAAAHAVLGLLRDQAFPEPWMATTQPAPAAKAQTNDVTESSDGVLGTIGRFFSGGNSLRRSLEDHGIDPEDATAIDESLAPLEAVVTVFVGDREGAAIRVLEDAGGRVPVRRGGVGAVRTHGEPAADAGHIERSLVVVDPTFQAPMIDEQVFTERPLVVVDPARESIPVTPESPAATEAASDKVVERRTGLNDLL